MVKLTDQVPSAYWRNQINAITISDDELERKSGKRKLSRNTLRGKMISVSQQQRKQNKNKDIITFKGTS